jgi:hypothetical protein
MPPAINMAAYLIINCPNPAGVICNWPAGITPRQKPRKLYGSGVPKRVSITVTIGRNHAGGLKPCLSLNQRWSAMNPCFKGCKGWPEILGKSAVAGLLLSVLLVREYHKRETSHALIASSGASMSALLKAAIGTGESQHLTHSHSLFTQSHASVQRMADLTVSRNIHERLSATIFNTCQNMNGTLRGEYHRVIIVSEQVVRAISIHGGIIHR